MTRRRFIKLATIGLAGGGLWLDAAVVEPQRIQITRYEVAMPGLPEEFDGLKIAQLSDLHRSLIVRDSTIRSAVDIVNGLEPDIAVLTGDFVSRNPGNAGACAKMLSRIKTRMGTYAVLGNHDHWTDAKEVRRQLEHQKIKVLMNQHLELKPGLFLLGVDDYWAGKPDFGKAWKGVDPAAAQVLLSHSPLAVKEITHKECLMITGHTHGGQVHIPLIPRRRLPGLLGWKYIQGWYSVGRVRMYVNRGIGVVNPPVRFLCRPEVTLFILRSGKGKRT